MSGTAVLWSAQYEDATLNQRAIWFLGEFWHPVFSVLLEEDSSATDCL